MNIERQKFSQKHDLFASNFGDGMNRMIVNESLKSAEKAAAVALPLVLTSCNNLPSEQIHITLDPASVVGHIAGVTSAIEEAFEKDPNKNLGGKAVAILSKYGAGFLIGHTVVHNELNGNPWLSSDNLPNTISLIPAAYVMAKETSLTQLFHRFKSNVVNKVSAAGEQRKQAESQRELEKLARDAYSSNIKTQYAAREQAKRLGISDKVLENVYLNWKRRR